jgi:replicative DNA helicase
MNTTDIEQVTIQYILKNPEAISELVKKKISPTYFANKAAREIALIIFEYHKKYAGFISKTVLEASLQKLNVDMAVYEPFLNSADDIIDIDSAWLVDELIKHKKKLILQAGLSKVIEVVDEKNIAEAENRLLKVAKALTTLKIKEDLSVDMNKDAEEVYHNLLTPKNETRIDIGLAEFDDNIGGLKPGWLVLLSSRPKVGKTRTLINFVYQMVRRGINCAVFTLEVPKEQYIELFYSCAAAVDAKKIDMRTLDEKEQAKLYGVTTALRHKWGKLKVIDTLGAVNPNYIKNKIEEIELDDCCSYDVIVVDHASMMTPNQRMDRDDLSQGSIAIDLREIAREKQKVMLTAVQRKQEAVKKRDRDQDISGAGEDIARSDIWFQQADVLMILHKPDDAAKAINMLQYKIISRYNTDTVSFELLKDFSITRIFSVSRGGDVDVWK